jgi:hypothetical protein
MLLAQQLRAKLSAAPAPPPVVAPPESQPAEEPAPDSLLSTRRALERGLEAWPARDVPETPAPSPDVPILQVGHRNELVDP